MFRFGKPVEDVNSFLKALTLPDPVMRLLTASRHLLLALWLSVDAVQWVKPSGFCLSFLHVIFFFCYLLLRLFH